MTNDANPQLSPLSKDDVQANTSPPPVRTVYERWAVGDSASIPHLVGWAYNASVTYLSVRIHKGRWQMVLKAQFGDDPKVAYVSGKSFTDALTKGAEVARSAGFDWQDDFYPPRFIRAGWRST